MWDRLSTRHWLVSFVARSENCHPFSRYSTASSPARKRTSFLRQHISRRRAEANRVGAGSVQVGCLGQSPPLSLFEELRYSKRPRHRQVRRPDKSRDPFYPSSVCTRCLFLS